MNTKMSPMQEFVFYRTYSRWMEDKQRRETWEEVFGPVGTGRYLTFMHNKFGDKVPKNIWKLLEEQIPSMGVMPSMRAAWTAGTMLESNNVSGYNCAYKAISDIQSIVEIFYVLMCGTGAGFSVEKQYVTQLPVVAVWNGMNTGTHVVGDSKEGWATALKVGLETWWAGNDVQFDFSQVRPAGARLKTMGGRASGPDPLRKLLNFCREILIKAGGRQLTSLEVLDITNMVAEVVVVGGVRRSSQISFSDLEDADLRTAKNWPFPEWRRMSNNSVCYKKKPTIIEFMQEWSSLAASGTGERGIFNLDAVKKSAVRRTEKLDELRSNPCSEIHLRDGQFCNLSEIVVRADDDFDDLIAKVKAAVWLGAIQSCLTNFPYLRPIWKENCEEERLLGVSLTGQMDNGKLMSDEKLEILKKYAIKTCRAAAKALGINMSVAITTGKPSGTVSQLVDCSSGMHARYAKYYIRRIRIDAKDPLCKLLQSQGVPMDPEVGQRPKDIAKKRAELLEQGYSLEQIDILVPAWTPESVMMWVVHFPVAAPKGAVTRHDLSAIQQLEWYAKLKEFWCEHNQSCTIYVKENEWLEVGAWVYENWDRLACVSFLPAEDDKIKYELTPYEEINEETYKKLAKAFPKIDYTKLPQFEQGQDFTQGSQSLACVGDKCEL